MEWTVYIIRCDDDCLYTGITTDVERRFREHAGGSRGARFFNGRRPVEVVYRETGHDRSSASRREAAIKKLGRARKAELVATQSARSRGKKREQGAPLKDGAETGAGGSREIQATSKPGNPKEPQVF